MRSLYVSASTIACAGLMLGCPNPNTYGTPRTIPKGAITHTLALEGVYISSKAPAVSLGLPTLPSYHLRYGVSDNIDIGASVRNLSTLGADMKWNFVRGDFDLALNPGLQYVGIASDKGSAHIFYLHAPVLAGFNLSDDFSIVANLGIVGAVGAVTGTISGNNGASAGTGLLGRAGFGLNIRTSKDFAIQPEVSFMRRFDDSNAIFGVFGLGFTFGKHGHQKTMPAPLPAPGAPVNVNAPASQPPATAPEATPSSVTQ
jgi:hypothetical protein